MTNNYLTPETIEELHVEITTLCNASCPMCARNVNGGKLSESLKINSWQLGDELKVFTKDLPNLKRVFFCGTHGDPIAAPYLFEAVKAAKDIGISIEIFTNGSLKTISWWEKFTRILTENDKIIFGIDGIKTNHLYRQNTNIEKILENLKICIKGKVKTQWDFLVFEHNEDELDECKTFAKDIGVDFFRIRKTARFRNDKFPVLNSAGDITHYLKPPKNLELRHPNYHTLIELTRSLPKDYNIDCLYKKQKKIYVNSNLEVFPCCYISDNKENGTINVDKLTIQVPYSEMSLREKSWSDILQTQFYDNDLVTSFSQTNALSRCITTCGVVRREENQIHKQ